MQHEVNQSKERGKKNTDNQHANAKAKKANEKSHSNATEGMPTEQ